MRVQSRKALFAAKHIDLEAAAQVPGARWEPFQIRFLNNTDRFDIQVKARQIAWSFTAAVDAVVDGILVEDTPHIFVSINQDEAKEKIRYARNIIEAIDPDKRPKLTQDSQTSLEFANGSRLISHPCRPPRGKPRARVYYDEMAHYQAGLDREVYRAGLPATAKGDGYIRIGSSPLGATGLFWEIFTEAIRAYPGYAGHRIKVPWWHVRALCKDVPEAMRLAPRMASEDRVRLFGTKPLVELFENMFIEDFQQEFECSWVDEAIAWISWDVIKRNQDPGLVCYQSRTVDQARRDLRTFQRALEDGRVEASLAGGIDIGRKRDLTEFFIIGKPASGSLPLRWTISLSQVEYDDQEGLFVEIIKALPFVKVLIDETGIGSQLAENLRKRTGGISEGQAFTQPAKEVWAVEARIQAERGNTPLPVDRDLAYQIHSIKKRMSATKHATFDTERNEKHHCYDMATEILTSSGWCSFADLTMNHEVATLKNGEYLSFEKPIVIQHYNYEGEMVRVSNKQVDLLVTPDHRVYAGHYNDPDFQIHPAASLLRQNRHRWRFKKNAAWKGDDNPDVPGGSPEQYAELLGYYLSEGCKGSQNQVILYQKEGSLAQRMENLLTEMGKTVLVSTTERGALRIESYWKAVHHALPDGKSWEKRIPRVVFGWSPRLLRILFEALMAGDGTKQSQWSYYTTSFGLAQDMTELCLRIGFCGSVVLNGKMDHPNSWNRRPLYRVNINRTRTMPIINKRSLSIWKEIYDGPIHCCTTTTGLVYVRRNGKSVWCGNSDKFWAWALAVYAGKSRFREFIRV